MTGFSLLWSKILDSSLWINGSKETRLLWVAMLAMKDSDGIIQASVVGLADRAKLTPDECRVALKVLQSPDKDDTSGVENGRRIKEVLGGWQIVNHELYRYSTPFKREYWRERKAIQRMRDREGMSPKEKAAYDEGRKAEYAKRLKIGVRAAKREGQQAGAVEATKDGFAAQKMEQ